MARMRTIEQAAEHFKKADPLTALTKTAIRRLVTTGEIPFVKVGTKYLLNLDALEEYLKGQYGPAPAEAPAGTIRRVM